MSSVTILETKTRQTNKQNVQLKQRDGVADSDTKTSVSVQIALEIQLLSSCDLLLLIVSNLENSFIFSTVEVVSIFFLFLCLNLMIHLYVQICSVLS